MLAPTPLTPTENAAAARVWSLAALERDDRAALPERVPRYRPVHRANKPVSRVQSIERTLHTLRTGVTHVIGTHRCPRTWSEERHGGTGGPAGRDWEGLTGPKAEFPRREQVNLGRRAWVRSAIPAVGIGAVHGGHDCPPDDLWPGIGNGHRVCDKPAPRQPDKTAHDRLLAAGSLRPGGSVPAVRPNWGLDRRRRPSMRCGTGNRAWRLVPTQRHWGRRAILLGLLSCTGCLHAPGATAPGAAPVAAVRYTATIENAPSEAIADLAERSLSTFRLRERGARNRANLLGRVRRDEDRLARLLRSQGYYTPAVAAQVTFPSDDTASARFLVRAGPAYTLTDHVLALDRTAADPLPKLDAGTLGSPVGATARAAAIVQAEEAAVATLHSAGYPYAAFVGREGMADPDTATVTVTSTLAPGPSAVYGPARFAGLATVSESYLSTYRPWDERSPLDRRALDTYQQRLMATQLFRAVSVRIPDDAPPHGDGPIALPVVVTVEEGPRRRVEAGVRYDTDLGLSGHAGWRHRNLFGANESLQVEVEAGRVKHGAVMEYRKPQYRRPGQALTASLSAARTDDHAFDARTVTGAAGLTRRFTPRWTLGFGGLFETSIIDEPEGDVRAYLVGAPLSATYDRTDRALDPTTGERLEIEAVPFAGELASTATRFGMIGARGSIYRPVDRDARYVVAARGRAAAVIAEDLASVPATRRLYAGGGGSVRGYAKSSIGPLEPDGTPSGGRSVLEAEAELRVRVGDNFGLVVFVAAGLVSANTVPDDSDEVQAAAGIGLRYFSPAGPIRLDLAAPLNARARDDSAAVYVSIGQAF